MWLGWSSRVLFPEAKTDESLSKVSVPSGDRVARRAVGADQVLLGVRLERRRPSAGACPNDAVVTAGERAADPEARAERRPHVPHLLQVLPDEALPQRVVVRSSAPRRPIASPRRSAAEGGLGGEPARLDRVVDSFQRGHVHEAGAVAAEQQAGRVQPVRQREEAALGDRLRAPLEPLAAVEDLRMCGCVFSSWSRSCTESSASR